MKTQALIGIACVTAFALAALAVPGMMEMTETLTESARLSATQGFAQALSALLALLAVTLPNGYFAWVSETSFNANRLLAQGVMKMILTITLIALCIVVIGIEPLGFFITLVAIQLAYWVPQRDPTGQQPNKK